MEQDSTCDDESSITREDNDEFDYQKPISQHFQFFFGDGDPFDKLLRLYRTQPGKYNKITGLPGWFHLYMKLLEKANEYFRETILFLLEP
eukprot:scaffold42504_cov71-Attheya_sp.AAC.1